MKAIGVPDEQARTVAASLGDWIDSDRTPLPGGAEDEVYAQAAIPYRAANTLLADVTELRAVAGVTSAVYAQLRPWVCVLPTTELSPINVNTLSPDQAPLVVMLLPDQLSLESARAAIAARPVDGWNRVSDFRKLPALASLQLGGMLDQASVATRWFAIRLDIEIAGAELSERGLIDAGTSPARLVARSWGDSIG
jgi:general secretion pathway protein K